MKKAKLIIWDLDDTLWEGSIAVTKNVNIDFEYVELIKELNSRGVISSICSNNYFDFARDFLEEKRIWDIFIMPNINYKSKALRIKSMISEFGFLPENVYFIDDNDFNINEVRYFNPDINIIDAKKKNSVLSFLKRTVEDNEVDFGARFKKYKIIENKLVAKKEYGSNEDFLVDSDIKVRIRNANADDAYRAHNLVHRTNQLNYTKNRISEDEILNDIVKTNAYMIDVADKYGSYGTVGFVSFAGEVKHFTFSCRILNMGVVSYVYGKLKVPNFEISGQVAASFSRSIPSWIGEF
jgi:FkbH-like protein